MKKESDCPHFAAKGWHMFVGYRVNATGAEGVCCHGCGVPSPEGGGRE